MLDNSGQILRQGLSGLAERQRLIANNLANMETPGYRPQDIAFERVLDRQLKGGNGLALVTTSISHMAAPTARTAAAPLEVGAPGVDVDAQMARLSETVIEFDAVAQLMAARLSLLRSAVTEGRR